MELTNFSEQRRDLHKRMAVEYQGFLRYLFVDNAENEALHLGLNEVRIKFLSLYFATHAPVASIFRENPKLREMKSLDRRYVIADYFSEEALVKLRNFPGRQMGLTFEHVIPKDRLKKEFESKVRSNKDLLSVGEIARRLDETWHIAVVTTEEDRALNPQKAMPKGWSDGDDVFARYRKEDGTAMRFKIYRANEEAEACMNILLGV